MNDRGRRAADEKDLGASDYEKPEVTDLGDAVTLIRYYSSGTNSDGSSDHPRVWWN